jgi:hypothetical protein
MSDLQAIADRVEIEALRGEFTDAEMMRDHDRLASLFTHDGAVRIPHINAEAAGREEIRAGVPPMFLLVFTSCAFVPLSTMPGWLQVTGPHQQVTALVNAERALTLGGPTAHDVLISLAWRPASCWRSPRSPGAPTNG